MKKSNCKGFDKNGKKIYELNKENGKIKEFYVYGKLEFNGEFLKGKINEKGKEYRYSGKLEFEGKLLKEKRYKGKQYYDHNKVEFKGEYKNGKKYMERL